MLTSRLRNGITGFNKSTKGDVKAFAIAFLAFALLIGFLVVAAAISNYKFDHLSAEEHLVKVTELCGTGLTCLNPSEARRHLLAIPASSSQYKDASELLAHIQMQEQQESSHNQHESYAQMQRNVQNQAHDPFRCSSSTENQPIMSFDDGKYWWSDDGRCSRQMQKKRDDNAQLLSYKSTTIRVDTDMDSSWLADEERTCQTYPDVHGRVATVSCNSQENHHSHNIPVRFWGGVDRNTISNWKCTRKKDLLTDEFVCKAID